VAKTIEEVAKDFGVAALEGKSLFVILAVLIRPPSLSFALPLLSSKLNVAHNFSRPTLPRHAIVPADAQHHLRGKVHRAEPLSRRAQGPEEAHL
jgi:hypothetical protein